MRRLVGRNFARIRREKGLTQEQVEELSGFSQQSSAGVRPNRCNLAKRHAKPCCYVYAARAIIDRRVRCLTNFVVQPL